MFNSRPDLEEPGISKLLEERGLFSVTEWLLIETYFGLF